MLDWVGRTISWNVPCGFQGWCTPGCTGLQACNWKCLILIILQDVLISLRRDSFQLKYLLILGCGWLKVGEVHRWILQFSDRPCKWLQWWICYHEICWSFNCIRCIFNLNLCYWQDFSELWKQTQQEYFMSFALFFTRITKAAVVNFLLAALLRIFIDAILI